MTLVFRLSVVVMLGVTVGSTARLPVSAAVSPPPLKIDLNAFDAMKKTMALPDGETLAYIDMGNPAGPAVVLIHGYTDSARDWVPMLPYLSKRLRLILVDIRGHGQSSKPECCYTRLDFAYDIKLLLDALGVRPGGHRGPFPGQHHRADVCRVLARANGARRADFLHRRLPPGARSSRRNSISPPRFASSRSRSKRTRRS